VFHGRSAEQRLRALLGGLLLAAGMVALALGTARWQWPDVAPSGAPPPGPARTSERGAVTTIADPLATPTPDAPDAAGNPERQGTRGIRPIRVDIPAIDVSARVIDLGINNDGTLDVPDAFDRAGWWTGGAAPGAAGPAVIVGHVDSRAGPGVFYRLRDLTRGDRIEVRDRDGRVVRFVVDRFEQHPKADFPTDAVYGHTERPTLRLVTCGGVFNRSARSYVDNLIVYASLAG
jgi:sortase (surface protein transpeptidase)